MTRRITFIACSLVLALAAGAMAQEVIRGTVVRIDQPAGVIMLDDGRMVQAGTGTTILVGERPMALADVQPGARVVIRKQVLSQGTPALVNPPAQQRRSTAEPATGTTVTRAPRTQAAVDPVTGTVVRIDEPNRVVVLDDNRMYRLTEDGAVLVDNQPVALATVRPGTRVKVRSGQPVELREGQYVVIMPPPGAASVTTPAPGTTVTTIQQPGAVSDAVVTGTVSRVDVPANVIVLSDGRMVQTGPSTVILVDQRPMHIADLRPGTPVTITAANPVVYRNGRYVLLNHGFRDAASGSALAWDSDYAGYDAQTDNAGMGIQTD